MFNRYIDQFIRSGNLYSLLGNLLFAVFNLITFLILVRTLDKTTFGQWVLFLTISSLIDLLRLGLTGTATIRLLSSASAEKAKRISASSYMLSSGTTIIISVLLLGSFIIFKDLFVQDNHYLYILKFYPLVAFANLPFNQASVISQGKINFKRLMFLKIMNGALCLLLVGIFSLIYSVTFQDIIISFLIANALVSLITIFLGWDELGIIGKMQKKIMKQILDFGKYSTASSVGSSLLRSADTIILSTASFMGTEAIAIYAIPLKFVEAVEIPLRSFTATAFPHLSKAFKEGKKSFLRLLFKYTFGSVLLLFPITLILISFPSFFLGLIGGNEYAENLTLQINLLYIICIYMLLLSFDRYSGVALFAINKPKLNFYKIAMMLFSNVVFDIVAVYFFQSLIYVALATLLFTLIGISAGWYILFRETNSGIKDFYVHFNKTNRYLMYMKSWIYLEK